MGCHSSCFIAQRITNAIKYILHKMDVECVNYLDDLGGAEFPELVQESFRKMGPLLEKLGIQESISKACSPSTRMIFLGIMIDTIKMTLELDENRLCELNILLQTWKGKIYATLKQVQSLVGVLSFASSCIRQGRPFFGRILEFLRTMPSTGKVRVPQNVFKDIEWWIKIAPSFNGISYIPASFWSKPDSWVSTDACLTGGGGYFNGEFFHFEFSNDLLGKAKFINQLELFVLWKAVEVWGEKIKRKNILIYCDNKTTVDCLRAGISRSEFSQACLCNILHNAKYRQEFYRLTEGIQTLEIVIADTEFHDLY